MKKKIPKPEEILDELEKQGYENIDIIQLCGNKDWNML